jgi:hypothetical protein
LKYSFIGLQAIVVGTALVIATPAGAALAPVLVAEIAAVAGTTAVVVTTAAEISGLLLAGAFLPLAGGTVSTITSDLQGNKGVTAPVKYHSVDEEIEERTKDIRAQYNKPKVMTANIVLHSVFECLFTSGATTIKNEQLQTLLKGVRSEYSQKGFKNNNQWVLFIDYDCMYGIAIKYIKMDIAAFSALIGGMRK